MFVDALCMQLVKAPKKYDVVVTGSFARSGEVEDATAPDIPPRKTSHLPRNPSPDLLPPNNTRPPDSLFTPPAGFQKMSMPMMGGFGG